MEKLTNFFNYAAKAAQKTGGGSSRHEALIIAEQFSQCALRSEGAQQRVSESETRGVNHAIITQLSRNNHPITLRAIRYVAVLLMVLMVGIGNAWGADQTFTVSSPAVSKRYVKDNIMIGGSIGSKKLANVGSQACFYMASGSYAPTYILSKAANIKSITIQGNRDTGSSDATVKAFNVFTSSDLSTFTTPTTGFSASRTNNGSTVDVTSLSDIPMVGNNNSYLTSVTITFTSPVMGIRLTYSNSTCIKSISVTYDNAITVASQLCEVHMTTTSAASLSGTGTWTASNLQSGNTFTDTESTPNNYYYNKSSGTYGKIDLGEGNSFQAGDEIWVDMNGNGLRAPNACGLVLNSADNSTNAVTINPNCTIPANMPMYIRYVTQAGDPWVGQRYLWLRRVDSNDRMYQVTIHRAGGGGDPEPECPGTLTISGTKDYLVGQNIQLTANLSAGNGEISYQWYKGSVAPGNAISGATSATYSKASCVVGDAGDYYCVASKEDCSDAVNAAAYAVTVTPTGTIEDLVSITSDYTYTASHTLLATGLYENGKLLSIGGNTYDSGKPGIRLKASSNVQVAFKVAAGAHIAVTFKTNSDRELYIGTTSGGQDLAHSASSKIEADRTEAGIVYLSASADLYFSVLEITYPEPACAATVPGNISKGTASDGTGTITLTAAGEIASGDTWYWQSAEDGTATNLGDGATKNVSAAGTYYIRSYNATGTCWSAAKSVTVAAADLLTAPTATFSDGAYVVGASALDLSTLFTSQNTSAVTFALKVASEDATVSGSNFTATKEGSYVVTASQVADASYKAVSEEATIVVTYPATGEATILYNVAVGTENTALGTASKEDNSASISNLSNFTAAGDLTVSGRGAGKDGLSTKLQTLSSQDYAKYIYVTFDVADGKEFVLDSISTKIVAVTTAKTIKIVVSDTEGAKDSLDYSQAKNSTAAHHQFNFTSSAKAYAGTVTVKIYAYGATDDYRLGQPLKVCGTVQAALTKYNLTFAKGSESASGSMATLKYAEGANVELPACTFTAPDEDHEFDAWVVTETVSGDAVTVTDGAFTMPAVAVTATATWKEKEVRYAITEGTPANGTVDADLAEAPAGETVTITATPATDYLFSAWDVYKTGESSVKVAVTETAGVYTFEMPAYAVTVSASFVADTRKKILYVTSNSESDTKSSDKLYAALKDDYRVAIVGPASDADQTGYDLVVLHESVGGSSYNATAVAAAKTGTTPVLNTKAYFYNSGRWGWGTPNAGKKTKGVHVNTGYCNITSHPLFNDLTPDANDSIIILSSINGDNKPIQPIGSFTSGKEGYTLANVPDGCAIHELTPAQRGAVSGKYLLISLYTKDFANLNANGQKLFQNAAAYLIGNTAWEPVNALSSPVVTASPSAAYSVGDNIALTASATGISAATTYTWYKGDTWDAAEEAGAIKDAATAAAGGNTYGITGCALGDAGTYWCVISNGTGCEVSASLAITVSDLAYNISFSSAHGTAPTATTGVSYTLPELSASGWEHQGWMASIDVTVDAETVTAGTKIANGKIATFGADVEFTAVWAEVFDITFNMQSHGASIAAQHIVDGGKATEPNDPSAIGWDFGGWFTDAECTEGNEFDFNTAISDDTELFAKWTAFTGCTELWPATSGDAPAAVGDAIVMQSGSNGAAMTALAKPGNLSYTSSGLQFGNESGVKVKVVLNNDMTVGTKISLTLVAGGTGTRGLNLYTKTGSKINAFTCWVNEVNPATNGAEDTFTYTVVAEDGLDGTNEFQLWRNNTVCLKSLKVESCGDAIIYHDLTSAISPDHDPAYATVTLGASSVREGRTTTAEYSAINAAYEFDEWQISGTGATLSSTTANPVTITMGTADAVVTLKLKAATPKHTVTFNKMGKGDDIDDQEVKEGDLVEEPTVTEPEGWILEGWYTENTFDTKWDFANDVMSTSDIELFANWVADTSIKLINKSTGAINTTNFTTAVTAAADVDGEKGATYSSARTAVTSVSALGEMVQYNATTNQTKIQLSMYNTSSNQKTIYLFKVAEGDAEADVTEINIDGNSRLTTEYYSFNSDKNRSFYVTVSDTKVKILQVKVVDDGATPMKQFGQAGYSLNFNKGRMFAKNDDSAYPFEGGSIKVSSDYKVLNNSNLATKSYIQFTTTVNGMILRVTRAGGNYYVSQDPSEMGTTYSKNEDITLATAGTWYIGSTSSGSSASFTKFEFIAPKCETPAFNALANSDICEGDPYVALDGTGTVTDGGTITYKWYAEGDAETVLATTATYTPVADGNYYVVALHHVDGYTDNEATSDVVTVTTHAGTAITEGLADQRGNVDDVVALAVVASGKNPHYAWKESATIDGTYTAVAGAADAASLNVTITEGMNKYYKVVVSSDCGADQESVAHVTQYVPVAQANVTGSIAWNWANAASVATIQLSNQTSPKKNDGFVMANGAATIYNNANFESDKLYLEGEYIVRDGKYFQGQTIKFNTTVPGVVRVKFSHTGNATDDKPARELYINGVATGDSRTSATAAWSRYVEVPAGEVSITAYYVDPVAKPGQQYIRVPEIEFLQLIESRSGYAANTLGTACYEDDAKVIGASVYELQGANENGYMVFDEITSGEIEAGKPYLFEATGSGNVGFYKKANATHADQAGSIKGMYGTFDAHNLVPGEGDYYYFSGRHIWEVNAFTVEYITIPAHRCYVDYTEFLNNPVEEQAPAPGRRRVMLGVNGTNGATGLENAEASEGRVQKVLIDGKIYILRGEKIFDMTGKLVK